MKIKVTQEHIDTGWRRDCEFCPIALACVQAGVSGVMVTALEIFSYFTPHSWSLPEQAKQFIRDFDNQKPVEPFEFEIPDTA